LAQDDYYLRIRSYSQVIDEYGWDAIQELENFRKSYQYPVQAEEMLRRISGRPRHFPPIYSKLQQRFPTVNDPVPHNPMSRLPVPLAVTGIIVEGFIHEEICYDIPHSKKNSHIPATTPVTLKRGQEILAGDWYACYEATVKGKPCK
jgi:hypothetical protein